MLHKNSLLDEIIQGIILRYYHMKVELLGRYVIELPYDTCCTVTCWSYWCWRPAQMFIAYALIYSRNVLGLFLITISNLNVTYWHGKGDRASARASASIIIMVTMINSTVHCTMATRHCKSYRNSSILRIMLPTLIIKVYRKLYTASEFGE